MANPGWGDLIQGILEALGQARGKEVVVSPDGERQRHPRQGVVGLPERGPVVQRAPHRPGDAGGRQGGHRSKQTAEQLALKAQRDLERIKIEAQRKVVQAQAEAEALRLRRQNVTGELVELRRIEAMQEAIRKWNGVPPQVTGGAMPFVDAKSHAGK